MIYRQHYIWLFVGAVVIFPIMVFAIVKWLENNYQRLPVLGGNDHFISGFTMKDHQGQFTTAESWEDKIVVADFFFTHCPSICPGMTKNLKRVQERFMNDSILLINSFTVDPERDSVTRLLSYATQFNISGNWKLLTGDKTEIYRLARKSFLITATDGDGGPNDFIHSDKLVLVDKQKRIRGFYSGTSDVEVDQLISDIQKLKEE